MSASNDDAAAVLEILTAALKVVAQAIELDRTDGLHSFIQRVEALVQEEFAA